MEGWISVYRQIQEMWIWNSNEPFDKRSAWIDLLLLVNHKNKSMKLDGETYVVERGCIITSILKLSKRWKWSRHKVSDFLDSLEKDNMIVQVRDTKKTLVSIVNYDKYQSNEILRTSEEKQDEKSGTNLDITSDIVSDIKKISESADNKEVEKLQKQCSDMSEGMRKDNKRTGKGHKQ